MKIVEINCPSCGGRLRLENAQSRLVTCEYCGNQFWLDDEKVQNITNYNIYPREPIRVYPNASNEDKDYSMLMGWIAVAAGAVVFLIVLAVLFAGSMRASRRSDFLPDIDSPYDDDYGSYGEVVNEVEEISAGSHLYEAMLEEIFEKNTGVSQEELNRITYLRIATSSEADYVWYSFDDPYGDSPDIRCLVFPIMEWETSDIQNFKGLVRLELDSRLPEGMYLKELKALKGISVRGTEISDIAKIVSDPGQITELGVARIESMERIAEFANVEKLYIQDLPEVNLKQLVSLKKLKELVLEDTCNSDSIISLDEDKVRVKDYSAISVMKGLEVLSLESDIIRDVGFLKDLPLLRSLTLKETAVISLESLAELPKLESLCLIGNREVQDFGPVGQITSLTELTIDKMTSQTDPDLSGLTDLERLDISGFMSVSSLRGLTGIKDLSIHNCNVDGADALSTLTGVERLTFYSVWNSAAYYLNTLSFLDGMTNLKCADFNGNRDGTGWIGYDYFVQVTGDVSSVFNHAGLEELYLDNGIFEIRFDKIQENPSLRVLSMKGMSLHENYYVQSYGGMTDVWYDDVVFCEHLDFLQKFPNLEELYLDSNELTDLEFARELKNLSRLSVQDNYITDLSPLMQLEQLTYLNITDNAVGELKGIDKDVEIIQ